MFCRKLIIYSGADNTRKMFNTWIYFFEFRKVVEGGVSISINKRIKNIFDLHNIHKIPIFVEGFSLQKKLHLKVVRMPFIFGTTVRNGQVVLGHKGPGDAKRVHTANALLEVKNGLKQVGTSLLIQPAIQLWGAFGRDDVADERLRLERW